MTNKLIPLAFLVLACGSSDAPAPLPEGVWAAADSPIVVSENMTVASGATLTIEPGVVVEFAPYTSLQIDGELIARGSEAAPITFTASDSEDEEARWDSLIFTDSAVDASFTDVDDYATGSIIEWCIFERAHKAIRMTAASPYITNSTFTDNITERSADDAGGAALHIEAGSQPRVRACTFTGNVAQPVSTGGAVYVDDADPILQDNYFSDNTSLYGGAVTADLMASPIVGNVLVNNTTETKGGGITIVSTASAIIGNELRANHAAKDGGGLHVCVDCFPHATPFILDNLVTENTSATKNPSLGAAGVGAAYLRMMSGNTLTGNLRDGKPSDFGWFHALDEGYPDWVANRTIANNWWGSSDSATIDATIFDGNDDGSYALVDYAPALTAAPGDAPPRVTITTRKLVYVDAGDPMPVFLTIYNPGAARDVELALLLQYGHGPVLLYQEDLDFPATATGGSYPLHLPANSVYFTTLLTSDYAALTGAGYGFWHAALFDADSGTGLAEPCAIRFQLGEEGSASPALVDGAGVTIGSDHIAIGDSYAGLVAALGPADRLRAIAGLGTLFTYTSSGLAGLVAGTGDTDVILALSVGADFTGTVDNAIAVGDARAAVDGALGSPDHEPFLSTWWYGEAGYAVANDGQVATRIHVF